MNVPFDGHAIRTESESPRCVQRNASPLGAHISHKGLRRARQRRHSPQPCSMGFAIPLVVRWLGDVRVRRRLSKGLLYSRRNPLRL